MAPTLVINEIYLSLQGESSWAGLPCVFVRLTGCNLRCSYCDTAYAFREGERRSLDQILDRVHQLAEPYRDPQSACAAHTHRNAAPSMVLPLVELTGGEPLLQHHTPELIRRLCDEGFTALVETSGALDLSMVDPRAHRIMDLKCPSSGESDANHWRNLSHLAASDEIKFVVATAEDYAWMVERIREHRLDRLCPLLVSWAAPHQQDPSLKPLPASQTPLTRQQLAEQIIADALPVRFQLQLHKVLWPPDQRGV